jgi:ribose transport system permease protein
MTIERDATTDASESTQTADAAEKRTPGGSETISKARGGGDRVLEFIEKYALVMLFVATMLFFSFWSKTATAFRTHDNITNVLGNQAVIGILAIAIIIPLVCQEFDFSVGPVAGFVACLCAGFMSKLGWPLWAAIVVPIAIGAFIGLLNGNTVARVGVNSLIVTLGVSSVLAGLVTWYTSGASISSNISSTLISWGSGEWLGIPRTVYFLAAVAIIVWYVLGYTPYGRYLHSIGSNRSAARLVGLRVDLYVLLAFVLCSTLAAVAGILLVARNGGANPQTATITASIQALAAAYLGATTIKPGRFNVVGTLFAIYFLAFTVTGLQLAGVDPWINDVFNGAALFIAVLISTIIGRRRAGIT